MFTTRMLDPFGFFYLCYNKITLQIVIHRSSMNFHLVSRSTAIENNLKHYFTGKACSRGVVWLRYSSNKKCCCPKCRDFKNKGTRDWNDRNKEERKAYYSANKEKILARDLRRTWKSRAGELGISKEVRDIIQQHAKSDTSSKNYDRADYVPIMRTGMETYNNWLCDVLK